MPSLLEKIHSPEDIKGFDGEELAALCEDCLLYTSRCV